MQRIDVEQRATRARELFTSGYNCAQSVFVAYHDIVGLDAQLAATLSAPFGGGMGRLREVCGTVSALTLAAGFLSPAPDPSDHAARTADYALVQELAERFRAEHGAIVCRELLRLPPQKEAPEPEVRTEAYYRRRPCADYVAAAARILGERIDRMIEEGTLPEGIAIGREDGSL